MKNIIVALFASSSLFIGAPLPAFALDVAAVCDGTVPEAWQRPGGFCDQNDFNHSLTDPSNSESCEPVVIIGMNGKDQDIRQLVASAPACCTVPTDYKYDPTAGRVILAYNPCCPIVFHTPGNGNDDADVRDRVTLVAC